MRPHIDHYLNGKRLYLSGPIEAATDSNWRKPVVDTLTGRFGIDLFDPFADPKQQWSVTLAEAKQSGDWNKVAEIAKSFVRKDLCMVDRADFLIAYLPKGVPTTGTVHEIINAINAKKPVLLFSNGDKRAISSWYWGFVPNEVIFNNAEELYEYLDKVDKGELKDNSRWAYVYGLV